MNIVYIHGLDSDANSTKGLLLERYCQQYHSDLTVLRPDLNKSPAQVFDQLLDLIATLGNASKTVLVGSSLGGYFATLVSNHTGCSALLLNPSSQPHITLQRFADGLSFDEAAQRNQANNRVIYTTTGGWVVTQKDLEWFAKHRLLTINYPRRLAVFIKEDDELLNPNTAAEFYKQQGAAVIMQVGGDHRFSDFTEQLPKIIKTLMQL